MEFEYKKLNKLTEERKNECKSIKIHYPDKIPIICERDPKSNLPDLNKKKWLVPSNLTVDQFNFMIKKKMGLGYDDLVYLIINGKDFISGDYRISEIYDKYKDYQDDLLYLAYSDNSKWL